MDLVLNWHVRLTTVPLKLNCLIKFDKFVFENFLISFVFLFKSVLCNYCFRNNVIIIGIKHFFSLKGCRQYLRHYWIDQGFKDTLRSCKTSITSPLSSWNPNPNQHLDVVFTWENVGINLRLNEPYAERKKLTGRPIAF